MPTSLQLDDGRTVTLNGSGNGTVRIGPVRAGQTWNITSAAVSVTSNTNEPTAKLYLGSPSPGNFLGGSYAGSNDADNALNVTLYRGQELVCVWEGGDAGAQATLSVYGTTHVQ